MNITVITLSYHLPDETSIAEFPNKIYSNYTVKVAMGILFSNGYIVHKTKRRSTAFIRTDGMLDVYEEDSTDKKKLSAFQYQVLVSKVAFVFTFGFENNQVAGDGLVERGTASGIIKRVRYTDEEGRFTRFGFWIVRDRVYDASDDYTYPLLSLDEADESLYLGLYDITTQYFGCGFINGDYGAGEPMVVEQRPTHQLSAVVSVERGVRLSRLIHVWIKVLYGQFACKQRAWGKKQLLIRLSKR